MYSHPPTHQVSLKDGSIVEICVHRATLEMLKSTQRTKSHEAQRTISASAKRAGAMKFGPTWTREHQFVKWQQIASITPLQQK